MEWQWGGAKGTGENFGEPALARCSNGSRPMATRMVQPGTVWEGASAGRGAQLGNTAGKAKGVCIGRELDCCADDCGNADS